MSIAGPASFRGMSVEVVRLLFGNAQKDGDGTAASGQALLAPPAATASARTPLNGAQALINELLMGASISGPVEVIVPGDALIVTGGRGSDVVDVDSSSHSSINYVVLGDGDDVLNVTSAGDATSDYWNGDALSALGRDFTGRDIGTIVVGGQLISGGAGNDTLNITAGRDVKVVSGGAGDDVVNVVAGRDAEGIHGDAGNDVLNVTAGNEASNIGGGAGDDVVNVTAGGEARSIIGGAGDDTVNIVAGGNVWEVRGGAGDDVVDIESGGRVANITGDGGDDRISIKADTVIGVDGGTGDDTIVIEARTAERVAGGRGDDVIRFEGTGEASLYFAYGDGRDHVTIAGETTVTFAGRSLEDATITYGEGSITVSFDDNGDSVTIGYSGAALKGAEPDVELARIDRPTGDRAMPINLGYAYHSGSDGFSLTIS